MAHQPAALPLPPNRPADVVDDFRGPGLSPIWIDRYLPHWTTDDRSEAHYDFNESGLRLRIDADQPDWRPEDAPLRVSNLQTGTFSGALGTSRGTHRHRQDGLDVRTVTPTQLLWAPTAGRVDLTVSATRDPGCMLAAWLIGTEHLNPNDAGEICIFEIDADAVKHTATRVRTGVKAHGDQRLSIDMADIDVDLDATRPHTWTAIWGNGVTVLGCEGVEVRRINQSPDYPLLLMVDLFEIGPPSGDYPKSAFVHRLRGWTL